ncbi:DUF1343 domain-containing protein [Gluconobacter sp. Dm-62]|uniref:exo-beta-N-acetylmuramidase NamZ family protein n=1 Tax=Gluconobacter sp. Dm-62 TaxID=2799804 RepID=UPI001B8C3C30|nr:DUF1343 domain-containing protein [Gluconobacter sp. Dm-62]MBS1101664.1 DUF1343 domain-containing protein [Gluconobacter sp. Dm-62]
MPEISGTPDRKTSLGRRTFMGLCAGTAASSWTTASGMPGGCLSPVAITTGYDVLEADGYQALKGRKVGLIANPTSVDRRLRHIADQMHAAPGVNLKAIFGPEHGFRGSAQAGHSEARSVDPRTGIPVYDMYTLSGPKLDALLKSADIDLLVFDIQDIGARFYTYIWSMFDALTACARCGIAFMVLDRPNPITGLNASGPSLDPAFSSFVGRVPLLLRHGMTVGELAQLFNGLYVPRLTGHAARLSIIPMTGWRRDLYQDETDLVWVPPSPNMPDITTALAYPGTCLFEGTTLSVGRGTASPFLTLGAPGLAATRWVEELNTANLPGCLFRDDWFTPGSEVAKNQLCHGLQLAITNRKTFDPLLTSVTMLQTVIKISDDPIWRKSGSTFDILAGSNRLRSQLSQRMSAADIVAGWKPNEETFNTQRRPFLMY